MQIAHVTHAAPAGLGIGRQPAGDDQGIGVRLADGRRGEPQHLDVASRVHFTAAPVWRHVGLIPDLIG